MSCGVVDTNNYFAVASHDDEAAMGLASNHDSTSTSGSRNDNSVQDKAVTRQNRIALAVERSRLEYKQEHACTERRVRSELLSH